MVTYVSPALSQPQQPHPVFNSEVLTLQSCVFQEVGGGGILRKGIFDKFLSGVTRQPHWFNTASEASQSGFSKVTKATQKQAAMI